MTKVLVLGVSGMLGSSVYRLFASSRGFRVTGTARSSAAATALPKSATAKIVIGVEALETDGIVRLFEDEGPDVVINCVGIIKQLALAKDPLASISINSLFPHRIAQLCAVAKARLIQISTDCVFDGRKGGYLETDSPNANDLYGRTKFLGEVDYPHAITLRTSIIGHEIGSALSLVDWFLGQPGPTVKGYRKAIFTGLPTVELARIIRDFVIPRPHMHGLWHVASDQITKYHLLGLIAKTYGKSIEIIPDDSLVIDRSLDGSRFRKEADYVAPAWPNLIEMMRAAQ